MPLRFSASVLTTATATAPVVVTDNLVLYYDPNNVASYAGTGTTINSLATTNLAGTMSNITFTDPDFTYNGTSSQISIADTAALEPGSGDWTMEVWFRASSVVGSTVILGKFDNGGDSSDVSYSIRTNGSSVYSQVGSGALGAGGYLDSTLYTFSVNTWYQVVYVWTNVAANSFRTYINGASIGSVSHSLASLLNSTNPLYIGRYNGGEFAQNFNGRIGITRLYNAALTAEQVLQNYNADKSTYGL